MTQSFLYIYALLLAFCKLSLKKHLLKFNQELLACWKKSKCLRNRLPQRTGCILRYEQNFGVCLEAEAIGVEAKAVCKYTASTSLLLNYNNILEQEFSTFLSRLPFAKKKKYNLPPVCTTTAFSILKIKVFFTLSF